MVDYSDASSLNFPSFAKTFLDLYQKWKEKRKPNNIINTNEKRTIDKYIHINKLKKKKMDIKLHVKQFWLERNKTLTTHNKIHNI